VTALDNLTRADKNTYRKVQVNALAEAMTCRDALMQQAQEAQERIKRTYRSSAKKRRYLDPDRRQIDGVKDDGCIDF